MEHAKNQSVVNPADRLVMKASFAKQFNPPLKGTFEEQEHKNYYDQLTLEEFINELQDRCATNKKARSQGH
jgi:hypothetical protein